MSSKLTSVSKTLEYMEVLADPKKVKFLVLPPMERDVLVFSEKVAQICQEKRLSDAHWSNILTYSVSSKRAHMDLLSLKIQPALQFLFLSPMFKYPPLRTSFICWPRRPRCKQS